MRARSCGSRLDPILRQLELQARDQDRVLVCNISLLRQNLEGKTTQSAVINSTLNTPVSEEKRPYSVIPNGSS